MMGVRLSMAGSGHAASILLHRRRRTNMLTAAALQQEDSFAGLSSGTAATGGQTGQTGSGALRSSEDENRTGYGAAGPQRQLRMSTLARIVAVRLSDDARSPTSPSSSVNDGTSDGDGDGEKACIRVAGRSDEKELRLHRSRLRRTMSRTRARSSRAFLGEKGGVSGVSGADVESTAFAVATAGNASAYDDTDDALEEAAALEEANRLSSSALAFAFLLIAGARLLHPTHFHLLFKTLAASHSALRFITRA